MKKRICFVVATPLTANAFLLKHFEFLSKDFDIYLVANFKDEKNVTFDSAFIKETKNIEIQRDISLFKDLMSLFELRKYFKSMQFDAVHSVTPKAGLVAMIAARLANINKRIHIFTGQVWHTKTGFFKAILKALDKVIVYCSTDILVDGASQRDFLIKNKIISINNSKVLGKGSISGVDIKRFIPNQNLKDEIRNQLNYKSEDVVFMFLGRLNVDKGVLDLAKAFNILNSEFLNSKLLLIGFDEENLMPQVNQICKNSSSIHYYGPTPLPEKILQAGDVFCLPSYREGFGTSVIEASLLEKPILCSDTYGLMETILDDKTGLRHEVKNVDDIYNQMKKLFLDKELRNSLGKQGREYVLSNFSVEAISSEWLKFYKEILK